MIDQTNTPWNKLVSEKNGKTCYGALEPCEFNKNGNKKIEESFKNVCVNPVFPCSLHALSIN